MEDGEAVDRTPRFGRTKGRTGSRPAGLSLSASETSRNGLISVDRNSPVVARFGKPWN
ncbi:hypothetical protein RGR602_PB00457 (plasmid) [Rhizobium gallicum bv. gallicum R602sp]|uniref:Uncharacterized protein n=1 Tax=Rhizobium gallicum bv. gallicum R602sp TaxID=1041138 RepID=A0A0B4XA63_9HYPH|nr:hypothetical protein RGR602_PB00457 [Rhizobium gallicum bv. gallicum R602sp]